MADDSFDEQIDGIQDPHLLVRLLLEQGEEMSPNLRAKIISMKSASIPPLINMLNNEAIQMENAPGEGWAPIHAVELLGELKAEDAIHPMLRWLSETDPGDDILHSRLITALSSLGQAAYQPVMDAFGETYDEDYRMSLCDVLVNSGVRSERIFGILLDYLQENVEYGAMNFAMYGDSKALDHLHQALDNWQLKDETDNLLANQAVIELCGTVRELGGQLTASQKQKLKQVRADRDRNSRQMDAMFRLPDEEKEPQRRKLGRNDPCWCGSGKKYKRCHWDLDRRNFN